MPRFCRPHFKRFYQAKIAVPVSWGPMLDKYFDCEDPVELGSMVEELSSLGICYLDIANMVAVLNRFKMSEVIKHAGPCVEIDVTWLRIARFYGDDAIDDDEALGLISVIAEAWRDRGKQVKRRFRVLDRAVLG
jgi:hypothetical protein